MTQSALPNWLTVEIVGKMGFHQRHSVVDIIRQLRSCAYDMNDMRLDGFVQWGCKQDLYRVKFVLDELLERGPKFSPEPDWLEEQEQERVIRILKNE